MKDKQAESALKALIEKANEITLVQQYSRTAPTRKIWLKASMQVDGIEVEANLTPIFLKANGGSKKDYITLWGHGVRAVDSIGEEVYGYEGYFKTEEGKKFYKKTTTETLNACY